MAQKPIIAKALGQLAHTVRAIRTKSIKMLFMKRPTLPIALALCALLSACGGGGSPYVPATAASCSLPLQYANGGTSGLSIAPQALSADRYLTQCNLSQVQTAVLSICSDHPAAGEVAVQLRLGGNSLANFALTSAANKATSCLANSGGNTVLREYTVYQPDTRGMTPSLGPWSLMLTDTVPTNNQSGYFVAWSLELQGLR